MSGTNGEVDSVNDGRRDKEAATIADGVRILVADVTIKFDDGKETHRVGGLEWEAGA